MNILKEFGGKTCPQIVSLSFELVSRATRSHFGKIVGCARVTVSGTIYRSNSIGFISTFLVIFSLSMNRVLANDETQTERSIARSLTQNSEGCGGIIGKVFNDANRNEFQDANETGLPGTRLVTQNGLQLITDDAGRFNSGCIFISTINSHTTILLKLDPQSLPTNYYLKGGNLRETILSQGQIATIDIGVSRVRIVQLTLRSSAFENKTINLKSTWLKNIERLIKVLDAEPSVLRLTYFGTAQDIELTKKRTVFLKQFIQERRKKLDHNSKLPIEIRLVSANG